ncbi:MAG: trypsin-like peptidase domain-containing protein [Actinobacteria bacterium]|nr:trypsin-like peptidase domain-containing protein [Actinomycetota bacterium]
MKKNLLKTLIVVFIIMFFLSFTSLVFAQESSTDQKSTGTDYQFSPGDSWLLVEPAVAYITTVYYAYVYDPGLAAWSEQYYYGPFGGTGFVVNPDTGTIVTAGHMVDGIVADYVNMKWAILDAYIANVYPDDYPNLTDADWNVIYDTYKVEGQNKTEPDREVWVQFNTVTANVPDNPGNTYTRAEVVSLSDRNQRDIAVIRIAPVTGRALSSVLIGDSSMVGVGDQVTIIGYPWTSDIGQDNPLNPTVTQGSISGKVMYHGTEVLQVQGDARPGNSGGPVLGKEGTVIGILTMGTDDTNNYLRPANDVKLLLGVENKLGQVDNEWRTGLAMFKQNHFSEAIIHFKAVQNLSAGHLLAGEYIAKAQANMGSDVPLTSETVVQDTTVTTVAAETTSTTPTTLPKKAESAITTTVLILIIVIPILVIALIVVLIVVLLKRKNRPQVVAPTAAAYTPPPPQQIPEGDSKSKAKFCPNCGNQTEEGAAFCPNCGNKLG